MTNTEYLREIMKKSGYKIRYIAEYTGISYQALLNKMRNITDFRVCEITKICELLSINEAEREKIFFANDVAKNGNK